MAAQVELGKVTGVRVVLDLSFILTIALFIEPYFATGNIKTISFGVIYLIGIAGSILVHELAHAHVGRWSGITPTHVEFNGLGGLCYFAGGKAASTRTDILVSLAGPFSNLVLWGAFQELSVLALELPPEAGVITGLDRVSYVLAALASANFWMFWFNLLPAFPLDGGNALSAFLSTQMMIFQAKRIVAWCGMAVAALCVAMAVRYGIWMLLLAIVIYAKNRDVLNSYKQPTERK